MRKLNVPDPGDIVTVDFAGATGINRRPARPRGGAEQEETTMTSPQTPNAAQATEAARHEWGGAAPGWRTWDAQLMAWAAPVTEVMLEAAQVRPGMLVLDLGSGTGEPALTLAAAVGPDGHVTATDLVPEMLAAAEEKARAQGLRNLSMQQAEAEALPFPDQQFDMVTCRLSVMHFANPAQALREAHRVLRPGRRAVFVAWGPLEDNAFQLAMLGPFIQRGLVPRPALGAANPFQFAAPGTLAAVMEAAGFQQVHEDARRVTMPWPGSVEECMTSYAEWGPAFRRILEHTPHEQRDEALAEARTAAQQYADGQRVNFPASIVVATGVR